MYRQQERKELATNLQKNPSDIFKRVFKQFNSSQVSIRYKLCNCSLTEDQWSFKKTLTLFGPSIKSKLDLSSFVFNSRMTFMAVRFGFYNCFSRESIYFLREARRSILCHLPMSNFRHGSAFGYITSLSKNGQESNN